MSIWLDEDESFRLKNFGFKLAAEDFNPRAHKEAKKRFTELGLLQNDLERKSGIYFFLMKFGQRKLKVYIGKSKNLWQRLTGHYCAEFQPNSPHDYRIRHLADFAMKPGDAAHFDIHIRLCKEDELSRLETEAICQFRTLLNDPRGKNKKRPLQYGEMKEVIQNAYYQAYKNLFRENLHLPDLGT